MAGRRWCHGQDLCPRRNANFNQPVGPACCNSLSLLLYNTFFFFKRQTVRCRCTHSLMPLGCVCVRPYGCFTPLKLRVWDAINALSPLPYSTCTRDKTLLRIILQFYFLFFIFSRFNCYICKIVIMASTTAQFSLVTSQMRIKVLQLILYCYYTTVVSSLRAIKRNEGAVK